MSQPLQRLRTQWLACLMVAKTDKRPSAMAALKRAERAYCEAWTKEQEHAKTMRDLAASIAPKKRSRMKRFPQGADAYPVSDAYAA